MKISVILPAYNKAKTIREVIADFHRHLPSAWIYVIDNTSGDHTAALASDTIRKLRCKGVVLAENTQGKAHALRKAFTEIESDIYLLADSDLTYPAKNAADLIKPVAEGKADMTVGDRLAGGKYKKENKRVFHNFGNGFVRRLINLLFRARLHDIMSGYRAFNRKFVKNFPVLSKGFEIETEMTLHALDKRFKIKEVPIEYKDRPKGSFSKLNTFSDGMRVLKTIFWIFKDYKPLAFFSLLALVSFVVALAVGIPAVIEYVEMQYVYKVPSAVLATGLLIFSMLLISVGFILDTVAKNHKFNYELNLLRENRPKR